MTTKAILLDVNVLIAASFEDHEHHRRANAWLGVSRRFATSPSVQGSLVRYAVRVASSAHAADLLDLLAQHSRHEFWPDDRPYDASTLDGVAGHRQVTDAYLASLAAARGSVVATFDTGFKQLRPAYVELVP